MAERAVLRVEDGTRVPSGTRGPGPHGHSFLREHCEVLLQAQFVLSKRQERTKIRCTHFGFLHHQITHPQRLLSSTGRRSLQWLPPGATLPASPSPSDLLFFFPDQPGPEWPPSRRPCTQDPHFTVRTLLSSGWSLFIKHLPRGQP